MDPLTRQLADVQKRYPGARFVTASDGQRLLLVPGVSLASGWNCQEATISILVPAGYPHVNPDCFYTDAGLRLASSAEPSNSCLQAVFGGHYRWFSWHVSGWDPATGTLDRYIRFCEARLREAR
ncbi:MAG TPA: E2/UBC family protein [Micromonosporaceae bacterium]|nr:E2/UBC family protein [Micromonosporaceae bacterium]